MQRTIFVIKSVELEKTLPVMISSILVKGSVISKDSIINDLKYTSEIGLTEDTSIIQTSMLKGGSLIRVGSFIFASITNVNKLTEGSFVDVTDMAEITKHPEDFNKFIKTYSEISNEKLIILDKLKEIQNEVDQIDQTLVKIKNDHLNTVGENVHDYSKLIDEEKSFTSEISKLKTLLLSKEKTLSNLSKHVNKIDLSFQQISSSKFDSQHKIDSIKSLFETFADYSEEDISFDNAKESIKSLFEKFETETQLSSSRINDIETSMNAVSLELPEEVTTGSLAIVETLTINTDQLIDDIMKLNQENEKLKYENEHHLERIKQLESDNDDIHYMYELKEKEIEKLKEESKSTDDFVEMSSIIKELSAALKKKSDKLDELMLKFDSLTNDKSELENQLESYRSLVLNVVETDEAKLVSEKSELEAKLVSEKSEFEAKLVSEKSELEAKLVSEKSELEAKLVSEKSELEAKLESFRDLISNVVYTDKATFDSYRYELEYKLDSFKVLISNLTTSYENQIAELKQSISNDDIDFKDLNDQIDNLEKYITVDSVDDAAREKEMAQMKAQLNILEQYINADSVEDATREKEIVQMKAQIDDLEQYIATDSVEDAAREEELNELKSQLNILEQYITTDNINSIAREKELVKLREEKIELEIKLKNTKEMMHKIKPEHYIIGELNDKINELQYQIDGLNLQHKIDSDKIGELNLSLAVMGTNLDLINDFKVENDELKEEMKELKIKLELFDSLENQLKSHIKHRDESDDRIVNLTVELEEMEIHNKSNDELILRMEEEINSLRDSGKSIKIEDFEDINIEQLRIQLENEKSLSRSHLKKYDSLKEDISTISDSYVELRRNFDELNSKNEYLKSLIEQSTKKYDSLNDKFSTVSDSFDKLNLKITSVISSDIKDNVLSKIDTLLKIEDDISALYAKLVSKKITSDEFYTKGDELLNTKNNLLEQISTTIDSVYAKLKA